MDLVYQPLAQLFGSVCIAGVMAFAVLAFAVYVGRRIG
jgi:hypothetical protein